MQKRNLNSPLFTLKRHLIQLFLTKLTNETILRESGVSEAALNWLQIDSRSDGKGLLCFHYLSSESINLGGTKLVLRV